MLFILQIDLVLCYCYWDVNHLICQETCLAKEEKDNHEKQSKHKRKLAVYDFFAKEVQKFQPFSGPSVLVKRYTACGEQFVGGEHIPPECLVMDASITKADAMTRLAVDAARLKPSYKLYTDCCASLSRPRKILQCLICRKLLACTDDLLSRIWDTHELSAEHRQAVAIAALLEQFGVTYEEVPPELEPPKKPFRWVAVNDVNYGPTCGLQYLVSFRKRKFCELCSCEVENIGEHFSCESHIMQYLCVSFPLEMFRVSCYAPESRMKSVLELLSSPKFELGGGLHKRVNVDWFPQSMEALVKPEYRQFPSQVPELTPLGADANCLFCPVCWLVIRIPKDVTDGGEALWNAHCGDNSHFDFAVRRGCYGFGFAALTFCLDEKLFVPMSSTVPKAAKQLHGEWIQEKEDKEVFYIQNQGDIGLEFVVDDQENQEVVCTLCAQWFARGMDTLINNHIRSFDHLNHYLKTESATRELMLEWLQRSLCNDMVEMRLYSPELAHQMRRWGNIPIRKVRTTAFDSVHRPVCECVMEMVDQVADDGEEKAEMSIKEALTAAAVQVHTIKQKNGKIERILCRCTQCEMAFSTTLDEIVTTVWDYHLSSEQHFRRFKSFMATKLDMLGFAESTSSYTVKPFKQQDPTRKVTWQWNANERTHEFVLSVIGLEDLVERRSNVVTGAHPPDFFCRLCAVVIPRRSAALETHVHSAQHVLCYVHKYHPQTIMELDMLPREGGKEMRRIIAQLLKDHNPKEPYCIPIYDPLGEQERKALVAMQKAKEQERLRQMDEARKKAQEQRRKKDEERRKQREQEIEAEKARAAERARRDKEARERALRLEEEKARVKKLLQEATRKAEEERRAKEARERREAREREKAKERAEKEAAEAERERRQDQLRSILDREKQRLKELHEKDAAQRRLFGEKEELEWKIRELHERANFQRNGPVPVPPDVRHFSPPPPPPQMRPPRGGPFNVHAPESFRTPLLGANPSSIPTNQPVPPPSSVYGNAAGGFHQNSGPTPLFPKFIIPQSMTIPVYKGMEDADRATRIHPPEPKQTSVVNRPSLRERKVDPYIANPKIIQTRDQLVDFIWRQGAERIPDKELPERFSEKATGIEGALGVDCLYEVICADCSDLDTFYCSMCGVWTTPSDMFKHLEAVEHKLAYLFRNYKMYHQTVVSESNTLVRKTVGRVEVPPPVSKEELGLVFGEGKSGGAKEKEKPKENPVIKTEPQEEGRPSGTSKKKDKEKRSDESKRTLLSELKSSVEKEKEKEKEREKEKEKEREREKEKEKEKKKDEGSSSRRPAATPERSKTKESRRSSSPDPVTRSALGAVAPVVLVVTQIDADLVAAENPEVVVVCVANTAAAVENAADLEVNEVKTSVVQHEIEEKLEQLRGLSKSSAVDPVKTERSTPPVVPELDEKAQMRKLLGVLVTLQQEAERTGRVDESIIDKLYREVGLKKSVESSSDQLLAQICSQLTQGSRDSRSKPSIDLKSFGIHTRPEEPEDQRSSIFGGGFGRRVPTTFQSLLAEVKRSMENLKPQRAPSPLMKPPFVMTNRDDVFPSNETISYVFPGSDSMPRSSESKFGQESSSSDAHLTKKERAALRRKQLLEEAERLRKEAEEDDDAGDDDDWDCLVEVINAPAPATSSTTKESHEKSHSGPKSDSKDTKSGRDEEKSPVSKVPGQRIPLQRTIFPDTKSPQDTKTLEPEKQWEKEREREREKKKDEMRQKLEKVKAERKNAKPVGTPSSWPQPIPQPLLGMQMHPPQTVLQPQTQQNYPQQMQDPMYGNNPPAYPVQYPCYTAPPAQQQFPGAQPFMPGQQQQQFIPAFDAPPMQPQPQFYQQPPYYGWAEQNQDSSSKAFCGLKFLTSKMEYEVKNTNGMSTTMSNRLHLFKNSGRVHVLRDSLRKRCAEKLRDKRWNQFESRRQMESVVRETVNDELKFDSNDLDADALLELFESVTQALLQEQYDEIQRIEEERLAADVEDYLNPPAICPACVHSPLTVTQTSAKCRSCSFEFAFSSKSPAPTQAELRRLLSDGFLTHEATECEVVELGMNEDELRAHILEQDSTIRELRSTIKRLEEVMGSKMNESILIETSNRINEHESRMFQRDIAIYEQEVKDIKERLRSAHLDLTDETNKRIAAEDNLRKKVIEIKELEHRVKSDSEANNRLQEKLVDKDQTITKLGAQVSAGNFEITSLKERLRKQVADIQQKIGELTATNTFLEQKVMEYEEKGQLLAKQLSEAQGNAETAKSELVELQKKLVEIEGSSSLTHQYLLEEASKVKQQKAALRCELLELKREHTKQKERLEQLESTRKMDDEEVPKLRSELEMSRKRIDQLEREGSRLREELRAAEGKAKELKEQVGRIQGSDLPET
ncbi:unnamed protein product [Nippostrongylus brasiliensis]|uniref:C2H2-type domain-containing protein n=1 Tax=Nippostrongylus brasiliensis TaxID=27835 RepID=A0A158QZT5_NIPBR|nr:unnamed protein product [Nippostrongylus brasiliensis]